MSGYTGDAGRFWQGTPGAPSIKDAWGAFLNANAGIIAQLVTGYTAVNIAGLGTYTLTTANASSDQARPLMQDFTGALAGNCTVTFPNTQKVGWARNSTTGGHNVLLTSGGGTQATLTPTSSWCLYWCDGSGNVSLLNGKLASLVVAGAIDVGGAATLENGLTVTGDAAVSGHVTAATGTSGSQVVNFSQFGLSFGTTGYFTLPNGDIEQYGAGTTDGGGHLAVTFPIAFPTAGRAALVSSSFGPTPVYASVGSLTTTGMSVYTFDSAGHAVGPLTVYWFARGN